MLRQIYFVISKLNHELNGIFYQVNFYIIYPLKKKINKFIKKLIRTFAEYISRYISKVS